MNTYGRGRFVEDEFTGNEVEKLLGTEHLLIRRLFFAFAVETCIERKAVSSERPEAVWETSCSEVCTNTC